MATAALATTMSYTRADASTAERGALGLLYIWSVLAIAGFALVRFKPEVLAMDPTAARVYAVSSPMFARVHVLLAGAALMLILFRAAGLKWVPAFVGVYAISLASELAGTITGLPFGPYQYTPLLGWKWFGFVPALIPLSWFYMVVPSYALGVVGGARRPVTRVLMASLILLAWDLALDPAMSGASSYWVWGEPGPYYGMPLLNLVGWYVTGIVLAAALEALRANRWLSTLSPRWLAAFYGANLLLPIGLAAVAGMWGAVALTLVVVATLILIARAAGARSPAVS